MNRKIGYIINISVFIFIAIFYLFIFGYSGKKGEMLNDFAMFNITFAVGIGAVLVGIISLVEKTNPNMKKVINFICLEFPGFVLLNFIVLTFSFAEKVPSSEVMSNYFVFITWIAAACISTGTSYLIYRLRNLFLLLKLDQNRGGNN